jgi:hypothetical protein
MQEMGGLRSTFSLYGLETDDLEKAREGLEKGLSISFEPHDSSYLGEYYLFKGADGEQIRLRRNLDPQDGSPAEPDYKTKALLLDVSNLVEGSPRLTEVENLIRKIIPKLELLKRESH